MKQRSIKLNFVMNAVLTMSSFVFPLITFPYISRILQPEGTGKVALATSVITYFNMFAQLGIPTYGIRATAQVRDDKEELTRVSHELLAISLIMSTLAYMALVLSLLFVPRFTSERELYVLVSFTIILSAIGMEWLYKGLEQYVYITVRSIIFKLIAVVAMFLLVHRQSDYVIYGGVSIFAASASNVLNFINAHRYIGIKPVGKYHPMRHMKAIIVFFAMSCATTIYTNLDIFMLGFMKTDTDVGYYNAAVKIKNVLIGVVTSLGTVLLPRCSYYIEHRMFDEFKRISRKAMGFVFLLASPLTLYFIIYAREGILFLSGASYGGSVLPMQVIMPTILLIGITNILGIQILVPMGKEVIVLKSVIGGAIADLILNVLFIPRLAATGAALGTLVAEVVVLIIQYYYIDKGLRDTFDQVHFIKIIIALILSGLVSFEIKSIHLQVFFSLILSAICFFGIYLMIMTVFREPLILEIESKVFNKLLNSFHK